MRIGIIGLGQVGKAVASAIVQQGLCDQLHLWSNNIPKAEGEAMDLVHSLPFLQRQPIIRVKWPRECDILVHCASARSDNVMTDRYQLLDRNRALFNDLVPPISECNPNAIHIVVTNPVDVMTKETLILSGAPWQRVIGISTLIDSARFRANLAQRFQVHPDDLRAYVIGEHGADQFPITWSPMVDVNTQPDAVDECFKAAVEDGWQVYTKKGFTSYAVAQATAYVISTVVHDDKRIIPLSVLLSDFYGISGVCLSVPVILGRSGVQNICKLKMFPDEIIKLRTVANKISKI